MRQGRGSLRRRSRRRSDGRRGQRGDGATVLAERGSRSAGAFIGRRAIRSSTRAPHTIVGVVADIKSAGLDKPERPAVYAPYTQRAFPWLRWSSFVVRTHGEPESMARADPPGTDEDRFASTDLSDGAARRCAGAVGGRAAVPHRADRSLRASRPGAVRGRRVRHHRLLGGRTVARNRRAHGARRDRPRNPHAWSSLAPARSPRSAWPSESACHS